MIRADELTEKYEATNQILKMMYDDFGNPKLSQERIDSLTLSMIATYLHDISISAAMLVDDKRGGSSQDMLESEE